MSLRIVISLVFYCAASFELQEFHASVSGCLALCFVRRRLPRIANAAIYLHDLVTSALKDITLNERKNDFAFRLKGYLQELFPRLFLVRWAGVLGGVRRPPGEGGYLHYP